MPTCRQINDVYVACTNLSASCDDLDTHAAIAACEDVIRASEVVLAVLGGPGPDVSDSPSSEESASGHESAGEASSSEDDPEPDASDDGGDHSTGDSSPGESGADDGGSTSEESGSEDGDSTSEAESSDDEDLSPSGLVVDYSGHADPSRHCDRCGYSGHTNQYCPTLPEPKRRRL